MIEDKVCEWKKYANEKLTDEGFSSMIMTGLNDCYICSGVSVTCEKYLTEDKLQEFKYNLIDGDYR